jgi:hypothetical protein
MASKSSACIPDVPFGWKEGKDIATAFAKKFIDSHAEPIELGRVALDHWGIGQALDASVSDLDWITATLDREDRSWSERVVKVL